MTIAGVPALVASVRDEERRGAPGSPVEPPTDPGGGGGTAGTVYPSDPIWRSEYSGASPSWTPGDSRHGDKFTYTPGTWEMSTAELSAATGSNFGTNSRSRREPTYQDQARLTFTTGGGTATLYAGRIDGSDRSEMNTDDENFDGVTNGIGSGYDDKPAMMNAIITTGVGLKDGPFDPAVFPLGSETFPDGRGPHRHSVAMQADNYWNSTTLKGNLGGLPDTSVDLGNDFLTQVVNRSAGGFGFTTMMVPYWPTFVEGVARNGTGNSGYFGRPRGVAGIPNAQIPEYHGNVVPPPQGLRMFTFKTGYFFADGVERFVAAFPYCWDGEHEWLPGGAHMSFVDPVTRQPPASHPYVIPFIHWFVDLVGNGVQSSQITDANPAAQYYGQRRDYWNYTNQYVAPHAELLLAWDPVFSEALCWMINNYCGLGRVNQRGDVGNV